MDQAAVLPPRLASQPLRQHRHGREPRMPLHQMREVEAMTDAAKIAKGLTKKDILKQLEELD